MVCFCDSHGAQNQELEIRGAEGGMAGCHEPQRSSFGEICVKGRRGGSNGIIS